MVRIAFSALLTLFCLSAIHAQSPFKDKKDENIQARPPRQVMPQMAPRPAPTKLRHSALFVAAQRKKHASQVAANQRTRGVAKSI